LEIIDINIPDHEYCAFIGKNLHENIASFLEKNSKGQNILIVTDEYFEKNYAQLVFKSLINKNLLPHIHIMKGGKNSKSFNEVLRIYGEMETKNFARDSVIIALGGGVIGDLAGFVASTWYRGMTFIQVPTTLMAMIDSSIGGKVAVNFRNTINAVGNYHHPKANFMDLSLIQSLSMRDYNSGFAEVIKCALISDDKFFNYLKINKDNILQKKPENLVYCMKKTINIKVDHVRCDIREGGKRLLLNFGHTLGHAIEMSTQTNNGETFRHGEGVSLGITAVLKLAELYLNTPKDVKNKTELLLASYNLPVSFSASKYGFERNNLIDKCMKIMLKDKKRKDNKLRFILLDKIGHAEVYSGLPNKFIKQSFEEVIKD
jgi:3-dehydroquinate synthase